MYFVHGIRYAKPGFYFPPADRTCLVTNASSHLRVMYLNKVLAIIDQKFQESHQCPVIDIICLYFGRTGMRKLNGSYITVNSIAMHYCHIYYHCQVFLNFANAAATPSLSSLSFLSCSFRFSRASLSSSSTAAAIIASSSSSPGSHN